jgi:hypothetical protein
MTGRQDRETGQGDRTGRQNRETGQGEMEEENSEELRADVGIVIAHT